MGRLIALETRLLLRDPAALALLALLLVCCLVAALGGRAVLSQQLEGRSLAADAARATAEQQAAQLAGPLEPADAVLLPLRIRGSVQAPLPPLVDFSAGRSALEPYAAEFGLRTRADTLFGRTQLTNPELAARGSFDLGFIAVVLAPLLLIGLGYGLFTADRETGAARLILAQAGTPARLLLARSLPRIALIAVPISLCALVLLAIGPDLPGRAPALGQWLLIVAVLLAFWWAVVLFVNTLRVTAETAALTLVALWAGFTLVLPPLTSSLAELAHPPPSRFEEIAAARAAEIASSAAYDNDHPELAADDVGRRLASLRRTIEIGRSVEATVAPIHGGFARARGEQQALEQRLAWLSPALVAGNTLQSIAGTDTARAVAFRSAAEAHLARFKEGLARFAEDDVFLSAEELEGLPGFEWSPPAARWGAAFAYLTILTALLVGFAATRFSRAMDD